MVPQPLGDTDIPATGDCAQREAPLRSADPPRRVRAVPRRRFTPVPRRADERRSPSEDGRHPELRAEPKPGGGVRWLTDLGRVDEIAYREAVSPLIATIEGRLGPEVVATRARRGREGWRLARVPASRAVWDDRVSSAIRAASAGTVFAVADVRDCYPAISPRAILRTLGPVAGSVVAVLERFVDAGVRGLPVGPDPSAILANAVLAGLDDALRRSAVLHVRWVDDVVLWGDRADVVRGLAAAHRAASHVGLELHDRKTRILDDRGELRGPSWPSSRFDASGVRVGGRSAPIIAAP